MKKIINLIILGASVLLSYSCQSTGEPEKLKELNKSSVRAGVSVHDPSIIEAGGKYYIFGSHMDAAVSDDLIHWKKIASGTTRYNPLFDNLFTELKAFDYVGCNNEGGYSVWAPDVIYNPVMDKYMMYFCTTSSYIKSNLCFALSDSVEGPYTYQDTIIYSGFTRLSVEKTNVEEITGKGNYRDYLSVSKYKNTVWPNAIDPALFFDKENKLWMAYGSWSGGIFVLELDKNTGYPIHPEADPDHDVDPYFGKHLAGGYHNSIEGPYIIYDKTSDFYYMFVSYGGLVSDGGYQIRLYRSKNPDGPYTDKMNEILDYSKVKHSDYGVKLMGNYNFPSFRQAYMAPGHNSAMINDSDEIFLVHHTRFDDGSEYHEPRVRRLFRTNDGWLTATPFAYNNSAMIADELSQRKAAGYYYLVNHGTDINGEIHDAIEYQFLGNGKVNDNSGNKAGSWKLDSGNVKVQTPDGLFSGVLIHQIDEAGNPVLAISALSDKNESIWAVQYLDKE